MSADLLKMKIIYMKKLKNSFNKKDENGYYYNEINENIKLNLTGEQPSTTKKWV